MMRAIAAALALVAAGCTTAASGCEPVVTEGSETLHIYVSNQSFDIDPVLIEVYIDDQAVVCQEFAVEGQHNWILFDIALEPGEHTIHAIGNGGTAEFTEQVDLAGERWAVIDFWWYPGDAAEQLTFDIYDQPIGFA